MKLPAALLALHAFHVAVLGFDFSPYGGGGKQAAIKQEFNVPGRNPLTFCGDPADNILEIEKVDLDPNPPAAGGKLSIVARGFVHQVIEKGATVHLQVKYGLITLINQVVDLCEQGDKVDVECPVDKGPLELTRDVELPNQIPPGKYTVMADVRTRDDKEIMCLTAAVVFHR